MPLVLLITVISFPMQIHFLYKIPMSDLNKIMSMLTPLNFLCMLMMMISAMLITSLNKGIYYLTPLLVCLVITNNIYVGMYGQDFSMDQVLISSLIFIMLHLPLYNSQLKSVILQPRLRWWQTPKRYQIEKKLSLVKNQSEVFLDSINISESGLLTKCLDNSIDLNIDDIIKIKILVDKEFTISARVVRETNIDEKRGFGLEIVKNENYKTHYLPWFKNTTELVY